MDRLGEAWLLSPPFVDQECGICMWRMLCWAVGSWRVQGLAKRKIVSDGTIIPAGEWFLPQIPWWKAIIKKKKKNPTFSRRTNMGKARGDVERDSETRNFGNQVPSSIGWGRHYVRITLSPHAPTFLVYSSRSCARIPFCVSIW